MWEDLIHLGSGHSLIMGHLPPKLQLAHITKKLQEHNQQDIMNFGLFDSTSPNYTTYYPDVTPEDFDPKDDEFIYPTFRALSEVIVHKEWNPVDFSMHDALKKSISLLVGVTVNPDHEARSVGNALGAVKSTEWEEKYKSGGTIVPAGMNAVFKIDAKSNPRIARGVNMDPPSIHSNSVSVRFLWDKSHPELSEDDFWGKLGTFDKDGNMIRRIVTRVKSYPETSLVYHGADPFAQKVGKDGKIVNPKYADTVYNSEQISDVKYNRENEKYFFFDFKLDLLENSEGKTIPIKSKDNENQSNNMDFLKNIIKALGMDANSTEEQVLAELTRRATEATNLQGSLDSLRNAGISDVAAATRLTGVETSYNALLAVSPGLTPEKLKELQDFQTNTLKNRRDAVTSLYNKLTDNKPEAGIVSMISGANMDALAVLENQYQTQLDAKFPLSCTDCHSTNVTRASSVPSTESEKSPVNKDRHSVRSELANKFRKKGGLSLYKETK